MERTQLQNKEECVGRLEDVLEEAWEAPKIRVIKEGISDFTKKVRRDNKRKRAEVKSLRKGVRDKDW